MKTLTLDQIFGKEQTGLASQWDATAAADDFKPLPRGVYRCRLESGELHASRSGTPGYKVTFCVIDGEHAGRKVWHDIWLSPDALKYAKRDLAKIGITSVAQLEQPAPLGYLCDVTVVLLTGDDGIERNNVKRFEVVGREEVKPDAFAPTGAA